MSSPSQRALRHAALILLSAAAPVAAAEGPALPVGRWEGPLKVGPFEHLVAFTFAAGPDGSLTATADVIDHGVKDLPCGAVTFADGKLTIEMPDLKGRYHGKLDGDGRSIKGTWKQDALTLPLSLSRVEKATELRRPQHPTRPYPYRDEDVTFENPAAKIRLAGTLTLPMGDGPFPAVVLVTGSGPQDRDETVFLHRPFLVLADHLTRNGIAVLRFDDRGVGKSEGRQEGATSADFATDAYAALCHLKQRKEVDPARIGIAGHSEGGWMAEIAAADHPEEVAFIILLASTGVPGEAVALAQAEDFSRSLGSNDEVVEATRELYRRAAAIIKAPGSAGERRQRLQEFAREYALELPDEVRQHFGEEMQAFFVDRWSDPWVQFSINYDPAATLRRVRCPVLAMIGEKDIQVRPGQNLPAIAAGLAAGGNSAVTIREMPGLNHLFQESETGLASEYARIEETFAPAALEVVSDWILDVTERDGDIP